MSDEQRKVSDLELLIANGPRLVGVAGANEKRWSNRFHGAFLEDLLKTNPIWDAEDGETIDSRLDFLKGLYMAAGADESKVSFWIGLIVLKAHTHAIQEHGREDLKTTHESIRVILAEKEADNPEFAQYMTVEQAATQGNWA
jgi:hypothetical protein